MRSLAELRRLLQLAVDEGTKIDPAPLLELVAATEASLAERAEELPLPPQVPPPVEIDRYIDALVAIARLDFQHELPVTGDDERLDALAIGINALAEELQSSTVSLDFVRSIIDSMADTLIVSDRHGTIQLANLATARTTGRPIESLAGEQIAALGGRSQEEVERILAGIEPGSTFQEELHYVDRDGRSVATLLSARHVEQADRESGYFVWVGTDITERQRLETEVRDARDVAIASSIARSNFLANMSHEIRTPMNAVIGMTGLLLETELDPQQRSFAEIVRTSGESLLALINDILDFTKIEAGNLEIERIPAPLRECVEGALDVVAVLAAEKGIELTSWIPAEVPLALYSDPTRLQQVLVNLLGNAVKFTEEGHVAVEVALRGVEDGVCTVEFAIQDSGIGIAAETIEQLFEPFTQAETSTTRRFGGTGLGLTICRRLTEAMGGEITVESEVGVGSTFRFTIVGPSAPYVRPRHLDADRSTLAGHSMLVVDDNLHNLRILRYWLETWGIRTETATSSREALRLIQQGRSFDCAILDMDMPEMDGLELAEAIRALPSGASIPLMMLTSLSHIERDPRGALFCAVHSKPVKPSNLFDSLHRALATADAPTTPPYPTPRPTPELALPPARILLAEDNSNNQKVAALTLRRLGYRIDTVADGLEVLSSLRTSPYDIVLMDVHMPRMDGLEASRRIRDDPQLRQPYIIAVTASATVQDRDVCLAAGMDDFISKPYRIQDLRRVLTRYATSSHHHSASSSSTSTTSAVTERGSGPGQARAEVEPTPPGPPRAEPTASGSAVETLNPRAFAELKSLIGDHRALGIFIDECLPGLAALTEEVAQAISDDDRDAIDRTAHMLKPNAATIGANELYRLAMTIESALLGPEPLTLGPQLEALGAAHRRYLAALAELRARESW